MRLSRGNPSLARPKPQDAMQFARRGPHIMIFLSASRLLHGQCCTSPKWSEPSALEWTPTSSKTHQAANVFPMASMVLGHGRSLRIAIAAAYRRAAPMRAAILSAALRGQRRPLGVDDFEVAGATYQSSRVDSVSGRGTAGALDRVAQIAERKYCRPHARPFRLGFPRKVPLFPICPPAAL